MKNAVCSLHISRDLERLLKNLWVGGWVRGTIPWNTFIDLIVLPLIGDNCSNSKVWIREEQVLVVI